MSFRRDLRYVEGNEIHPSNILKQNIEQYAADVAALAEFAPGDDPATIAKRLGGRIHYQSLDEWIGEDGSIFVHGESDFDIVLPHYTSPLRDRFTIAHELGHYFLHSDQGEIPIIAYRKGTGRLEWEANWFAAGFLMPQERFKEIAKRYQNLAELASEFGVSVDAARVRKESLGV